MRARWVVAVAVLAAFLVLVGCEPNDDVSPRDCGETSAPCEGQ